MWQAIALAFGLAMDATAVSAARGLADRKRELVILPLWFGGFQSGMAALGWVGGAWGGKYIERWDGWIAFGLLALIGGKMLYEAWRGGEVIGDEDEPKPGSFGVYLGLAVATSIDAAAAGLTLPMLPVEPWLALVLIGAITAACSMAGFVAGRQLGRTLGKKLEIAGGVVLIAIGIEILVSSLM